MARDTTSLPAPSNALPVRASASIAQAGRSRHRLSLFTFLMSSHQMPVCASMMVGDAGYLRRQLRLACTTDDEPLQQLAIAMLHELAVDPLAKPAIDMWSH